MKIKNLIKSYGFWTGLAGACVVLVNALSRAFGFEIEDKLVSDIIMAVAGVLVVFGLVSVPKEIFEQKNDELTEENKEEKEKNTEKSEDDSSKN